MARLPAIGSLGGYDIDSYSNLVAEAVWRVLTQLEGVKQRALLCC